MTGFLEEDKPPCMDSQFFICERRGWAFSVKLHSGPFLNNPVTLGDQQEFLEADPFGFLAYLENGHTELRQDTLSEFSHTPWYSDFHHRMLLLVGLEICDKRSIRADDRETLEAQMGWFDHGLHQVIELARGPIRESQPEIAKTILDLYLPVFLRTVGVRYGRADEEDSTKAWESMKEGRKYVPNAVTTYRDGGGSTVLVDRRSRSGNV